MSVRILIGDVFERMRQLPDESVDCVVTSPPYWGLRDYGVEGQIGLEPTLGEHIDTIVSVCAEIHRIIKPAGTLWLNYGDCYATTPNGRSAADAKAAGNDDRTFRDKPFSTIQGVLKPKDLCMLPNRIAIALQEAGWWVRSEIVWGKPNPMPESIKDRPATAHEKIFLLTKSAKYFYAPDLVRQGRASNEDAAGFRGGSYVNGSPGKRPVAGNRRSDKQHGRNLRNYEPAPVDVWRMATRPFAGAHFATFPPELVERCLKAGCPAGGVVLDPFGGAGTVGLVADRLGRHAILIEINPDYAAMAVERLRTDAGLFSSVDVEACGSMVSTQINKQV